MDRGFWELEVYRRAARLADELRACAKRWDSFDRWTAGVQLVRSADSVGANIAEAFGRDRHRDQRRFLFIARGSACEVQHWISAAEARDLPLPSQARSRAAEVARMLNGLIEHLSEH